MDSTVEPVIFVIGAPGCGKGTLCKRLCEEYGIAHMSVGDMIRRLVSSPNTDLQLMSCMQTGELVPIEVLAPVLKSQTDKERRGSPGLVIVDGFPRRLDQAAPVEVLLGSPVLVLFFNCPEQIASKRFLTRNLAGRERDDMAMFTKRYGEFERLNPSIVEHYRARGILLEIDTSDETDVSFRRLVSTLEGVNAWMLLVGSTRKYRPEI